MHRQSHNSVRKLFSKDPFNQSPKATFSFSLTTNPAHLPITDSSKSTLPNVLISKFHHFLHPNPSNVSCLRRFSGGSGELNQSREVDIINLKFAEAREEIETAMESKETVYFNEEAECARAAVKEVLDLFEGLLEKLPESEKAALKRSMGLKIEQLKAELQQLDE